MAKLSKLEHPGMDAYLFTCPGCDSEHMIVTRYSREYAEAIKASPFPGTPVWSFNDSLDRPTFQPSLLTTWTRGRDHEKRVCHLFVRDGKIEFLNDCTHALKGKTVEMAEVSE